MQPTFKRTFDTAKLPERIRWIVEAIREQEPDVSLADIESNRRYRRVCEVRWRIYWTVRQLKVGGRQVSQPMAGRWFGVDHTSILHGERRWEDFRADDIYADAKHTNILQRAYELNRAAYTLANPHTTRDQIEAASA